MRKPNLFRSVYFLRIASILNHIGKTPRSTNNLDVDKRQNDMLFESLEKCIDYERFGNKAETFPIFIGIINYIEDIWKMKMYSTSYALTT